jgi:hypothetical protein
MLGNNAAWALICLFIFSAQNKPDGDLSGMDDGDIELAVDWEGEDGTFVAALVKVGFLEGEKGSYRIHDWAEHNGWVYGSEDRNERARFAALCKNHGRAYAEREMPEYAAKLSNRPAKISIPENKNGSSDSANSIPVAVLDSANSIPVSSFSSAPSPSPSPVNPSDIPNGISLVASVPLTTHDDHEKIDDPPEKIEVPPRNSDSSRCPQQEILALYAKHLAELQYPRSWEGARSTNLAARWRWVTNDLKRKGVAHDRDAGLDFFRRMFGYIAKSDFLMGRTKDAWHGCDLAWIVKSENFLKIIEGKYENREALG